MITIEDVLQDLDDISTSTGKFTEIKTDGQKFIAAAKVLMKFLSTMRTNQLLTEDEKKVIQEQKKRGQKK